MVFHVYYRGIDGAMHQVDAEADSADNALAEVENLLVQEKEKFCKPLLAMVVGGKGA